MKYQNYVYLDTKANRLVLVQSPLDNKDFIELMKNEGTDQNLSINYCKIFCLGYILGSLRLTPVVNDIKEFE